MAARHSEEFAGATLQASASDVGVAACAATVKIKIIKRGGEKKGGVFSFCLQRLNLFLGYFVVFPPRKIGLFLVSNCNFD